MEGGRKRISEKFATWLCRYGRNTWFAIGRMDMWLTVVHCIWLRDRRRLLLGETFGCQVSSPPGATAPRSATSRDVAGTHFDVLMIRLDNTQR